MAGRILWIASTSGLSSFSRKSRAYVDRDSINLHCPSANIVSNARDDLPEPETPVTAMTLSWGRRSVMFLEVVLPRPLNYKLSI